MQPYRLPVQQRGAWTTCCRPIGQVFESCKAHSDGRIVKGVLVIFDSGKDLSNKKCNTRGL